MASKIRPSKAQLELLQKLTTTAYGDRPWSPAGLFTASLNACLRHGWVELFDYPYYKAVRLTEAGKKIRL